MALIATINRTELKARKEAPILIEYAKAEAKMTPKMVILMLKDILTGKKDFETRYWSWKLADYIDQKTNAILVEKDSDVDVETGDWGLPVITGAGEIPISYEVRDREYLFALLQAVEDNTLKISNSINKFLIHSNKPKWICQCGRFLGKELNFYEEIRKLIAEFDIGNYWRCRSCKKLNYFKIDRSGNIHFYTIDKVV